MKTKVRAVTSVMHGNRHLQPGDEVEVTKGEAQGLVDAGLASIVYDEDAATAPQAEQKMDDEPKNKMDAAPENKSEEEKPTRKTSARKAD